MTPFLTRLLLAALASVSILLARKALREQAPAASSQEADLARAPRRWVGVRQLGPLSARRQPYALPTFYEVRWLGPPRAGRAANER